MTWDTHGVRAPNENRKPVADEGDHFVTPRFPVRVSLSFSLPAARSPAAATAPSSAQRYRDVHDRRRRRRRRVSFDCASLCTSDTACVRCVRCVRACVARHSHAGNRAITRARGGRGRSSESMTGIRATRIRCTERSGARRAWTACAAPRRESSRSVPSRTRQGGRR